MIRSKSVVDALEQAYEKLSNVADILDSSVPEEKKLLRKVNAAVVAALKALDEANS